MLVVLLNGIEFPPLHLLDLVIWDANPKKTFIVWRTVI